MKLSKLLLFVTDLREAKRFYSDVLGFSLTEETETMLLFEHEDTKLVVYGCEKRGSVDDYATAARSVFVFEVPSVDDAIRDLSAKGVNFLHETPAEGPHGRYAAFVDPFGNVHEVSEAR